jgi:protein TonB
MTAMPHPAPAIPQPRPTLPRLRLPTERRRLGPGALLAILAHTALVVALFWRGAALLAGGGSGPGPRGGGGGGGRPAVRFLSLPAFSAPRAFEVPAPPQVAVSDIPLPDPSVLKLPPVEIPKVTAEPTPVVGTAPGTGGGPGSGPGSGGGQGTGTGPGTGSDVGPGTGGEGSYIFRADLKGMIVPPDCAPRGRYLLRFWVAADGRVSDVAIDPLPKDASCRRDFVERMKAYRFAPAHTRDGQAVASIYPIKITR